jgi:hypothetical protein
MILKPKDEVRSIIAEIDQSTISVIKRDFIKQINEDPDEEYEHVYFHQSLTNRFKRGNRIYAIHQILFVLTASAFLISLQSLSIISYYLFITSIIFAVQVYNPNDKN